MKSVVSAPKQILAIVGPTASGKTEVACAVSKILPVEIISCDSMQIYKGMSIVTQACLPAPARPCLAGRQAPGGGRHRVYCGIPYHLVAFLDPSKEYNAAFFRKDALGLITRILKRKKIPLFVGGTGLYLRALLDGLFEPEKGEISSDEALRNKLLKEQKSHGGDYLHQKLEKIDPASARKIHPNDLRRIVRALEVFYLTKKPLSEQKANRKGIRGEFDCRIFFLDRDRNDLYRRIDHRVNQMIKEGLVQEVKKLNRKKLSMTAQMALGIREMNHYLSAQCSLVEASEFLKKHTRNYAKRQISWFRHEKGVEIIPILPHETSKEIAERIVYKWRTPSV